jgi:hypothetical protein
MSSRAQKIVEELRALSEEERADVIAQVVPLPPEDDSEDMDPAWRDELQRRVDSIASGDAVLIDFEESYARLVAKFEKK